MGSVIKPSQTKTQTVSLMWNENKVYESPDRCLEFYVYLSGPFASLRVSESSSFDLQQEIKGGLDEWTKARFHLELRQNETLRFEIVTEENSEGQHGTFALDNVENLPYTGECTNLPPTAVVREPKTATEVPTEPPDRKYHFFFPLDGFLNGCHKCIQLHCIFGKSQNKFSKSGIS